MENRFDFFGDPLDFPRWRRRGGVRYDLARGKSIMGRFVYQAASSAGTGLVEIKEYDFTDSTAIDISNAGTHNVLKSDGSTALCTIICTHDASGGTIDGTRNIDVNSSGIVVDVTSDSGGENVVLAMAMPTDLKDTFDVSYMMFEWLISGLTMTGTNNSLVKFKVSTSADMRGTPANGLVVIKSSAASGYDVKGEVQYSSGTTRTSADQAVFTGGDLHVQLLMRRQSGVVYIGTGTSFAEPYSLTTSFGLGGRSFPATRPCGSGASAPQWGAPYMSLMFDANTTSDRVQATIKKFRICKFSPSVS
jgi:hypothetical protein